MPVDYSKFDAVDEFEEERKALAMRLAERCELKRPMHQLADAAHRVTSRLVAAVEHDHLEIGAGARGGWQRDTITPEPRRCCGWRPWCDGKLEDWPLPIDDLPSADPRFGDSFQCGVQLLARFGC